jgi:hypothetical protein
MAYVSGALSRAGPMTATVCSMAAALAPYPARKPATAAARARATPPESATQNCADGVAREARNDTVAT